MGWKSSRQSHVSMCILQRSRLERPQYYEAFTRAFTSDWLKIIRVVTGHNAKIMSFSNSQTSSDIYLTLPYPCHLFFLLKAFKRGFRKLPEFQSEYYRVLFFYFFLFRPSILFKETTALTKTIFTRSILELFSSASFSHRFFCRSTDRNEGPTFLLLLSLKEELVFDVYVQVYKGTTAPIEKGRNGLLRCLDQGNYTSEIGPQNMQLLLLDLAPNSMNRSHLLPQKRISFLEEIKK